MKTHWRLPRGVDELLPPQAWQLELLRRKVLDLFTTWGFDYLEPPVIEYLESLLVASGEDLDLQTLKVIDQVSGRQLGVRADMTSQAVRIDAHSLATDAVQRLCYAGPVVFASPKIALTSRVPYKVGAEIFGASTLDADAEIVALMLATVDLTGVEAPVLLLGHMGIYRGLVQVLLDEGSLEPDAEAELFRLVQRKSQADIRALLKPTPTAEVVAELPTFMGNVNILDAAEARMAKVARIAPVVHEALAELRQLARLVAKTNGDVQVRLDIAELSGYGYHNGAVFAVYHPQHGRALAQGGRYDGVGKVFGKDRAATGFDIDLKSLLVDASDQAADKIFAPFAPGADQAGAEDTGARNLRTAIANLRERGEIVQSALSVDEEIPAQCTRVLVQVDGRWQVKAQQT